MTQSEGTFMLALDQIRAQAAENRKLLWLFLAPQFETSAWQWFEEAQKLLKDSGLDSTFHVCAIDSLEFPQIDQSAQYLMQSLKMPPAWPVNLIIHPESQKAIVGFHMMVVADLPKLLGDLALQWIKAPQKLANFAATMTAGAVRQDPLCLQRTQAQGEKIQTVEDLAAFFVSPLVQSLDARTGLLGESFTLTLHTGVYQAFVSSREEDLLKLGQATLTRLFLTEFVDALDTLFWSRAEPTRLVALLSDQLAMLEVLTCVVGRIGNSFFSEMGVELFASILKRFVVFADNGSGPTLKNYVEYPRSDFEFSTSDLLVHLDSGERLVAQKFFGLSSKSQIPRIANTVAELAKELQLAPLDVKLALLQIKKKLREFREKRVAQNAAKVSTPPSGLNRAGLTLHSADRQMFLMCETYRVLAQAAEVFKIPLIGAGDAFLKLEAAVESVVGADALTPFTFEPDARMTVSGVRARVELLIRKSVVNPVGLENWKTLSQHIISASNVEQSYEVGFLDSRYDCVDHFGPSLVASEFAMLARALEVESLSQFLGSHVSYSHAEGFELLNLVKRLGVGVGHFYAAFMEYDERVQRKSLMSAEYNFSDLKV